MVYYNQKEENKTTKQEENKMRKVNELTTEEYIDCVIASEKKNFKKWCENHNIDYEDVVSYDWD